MSNEVVISLEVEQDLTEVRGNALASGDAAADRECEDEIIARLNDGDVWAWACVRVVARRGNRVAYSNWLGGCSYRDEDDFCQPGGYFDDMKAEALAELG